MKKVLFALVVLCAVFYSCDSLDLSDVGYGDGDRLKPSDVKSIVYAAPDGCWATEYAGYKFYFQFKESGTVTMDSEQMKDPTESAATFTTKGKETLLTIEGGGHFAYLGSDLTEDQLVISEVSKDKIVCKGENTGASLILVPATKAAMDANTAQKADFLKKIRDYASLIPAVVRYGSEQFVAYYMTYVDYQKFEIKIKVITIEKTGDSDLYGHTKVYTSTLKKEGELFLLETPVPEFKTMTTSDKCSIESIKVKDGVVTINGLNSAQLTVTSNDDAVVTFDNYQTKWACAKESVHGTKGAACQEIWNETGSKIDGVSSATVVSIELFSSYGDDNMKMSRPFVFWAMNASGYSTLAFPSSAPGASITKDGEHDRVFFTKMSSTGIVGWGGFTQEEIAGINSKFTTFLGFWYDKDGLYVAKLKDYIYLLSPTSGMWVKLQKG